MTGHAAAVPAGGAGLYLFTGGHVREAITEFTGAAICDWSIVGMALAAFFLFFTFVDPLVYPLLRIEPKMLKCCHTVAQTVRRSSR